MNKIASQILDKCIYEIKKEENISFIENELFASIFKRYNYKLRKLMVHIYTMYSLIVILLIIIILLLLFNKKYI